jgi:hypothetical protein
VEASVRKGVRAHPVASMAAATAAMETVIPSLIMLVI